MFAQNAVSRRASGEVGDWERPEMRGIVVGCLGFWKTPVEWQIMGKIVKQTLIIFVSNISNQFLMEPLVVFMGYIME